MRNRTVARTFVLAVALVLTIAACGGGKKVGGDSGSTPTTSGGSSADCEGVTLTAPEIGVSADTITVTVIADTGSPVRPGLFQGSVDGVKAWAKYINANGGLACRKVAVNVVDSKLSADDAKNGVIAACNDSLAMVGTTALFLQNVTAAENCKDKEGKVSGMADLAVLQTTFEQQCSPISYATLPTGASCPYSGTGDRTYRIGSTQYEWYLNKYGADALHGVFVVPKDLPSTIAATTPIYAAENKLGIGKDAEFGKSGLDLQSSYTEVAQAMKSNSSTYARNGLDYTGTVLMRKEARAQGVTTVKVWDCSLQCYDERLITEGLGATEDQYVWLNFLPLQDKGANKQLDAFLEYNKKPDGFGIQAWVAGEIFAQAVNDAIAANGDDPNAITRANVLAAIEGITAFDAGGLTPKINVGGRVGSPCLVAMQVKGGKFVRVEPTEPGTFYCGESTFTEVTLDPLKSYQG